MKNNKTKRGIKNLPHCPSKLQSLKDLKDTEILACLGNQLKQARQSKGKTLRDVAKASGLDNSKLSKIEKGQINMTILTAVRIIKALEIDPALFLRDVL